MPADTPIQIIGKRITLNPLAEQDWPLILELSTNPRLMKHVYDPMSEQDARAHFDTRIKPWNKQSDNWLSLSISHNLSQEKLGSIGLKIINIDSGIAETGFMLTLSAQGQGYASEALSLIKSFAWHTLSLNKLTATCSVHNSASYRLLEKAGFTREAKLEHNTLIQGQYVDDYLYGLYKDADMND